MKKINHQTLWGSGFSQEPNKNMLMFTAGRDVYGTKPTDWYLLPYELWGSKAHVIMLYKQHLISPYDTLEILSGLLDIEYQYHRGMFELDPAKEDAATNIESYITDKYSKISAEKLHTARSRNDQSSVTTRIFLRDQSVKMAVKSLELSQTCLQIAKKHTQTIMPGFTHHQHAMVTTFGHVMTAFASMFVRDTHRILAWWDIHNTNPLGSTTGYGTSLPICQETTRHMFGFDTVEYSSLDPIINRWEAESDLSHSVLVIMNHLSQLAETLILLSMTQFGMISLDDAFSTGSSIMPQKKNPDPLEVIKGKAGYIAGLHASIINLGKSNFIGYNRGSQWTKYAIVDLLHEAEYAPEIMGDILTTMKVHTDKMSSWCNKNFIGSTHLIEYIVKTYAIPFRSVKSAVETAVSLSTNKDKITPEVLQKAFHKHIIKLPLSDEEISKAQDPFTIIESYCSIGSPSPKIVKESIQKVEVQIQNAHTKIIKKQDRIDAAKKTLNDCVQRIIKHKTQSDIKISNPHPVINMLS